jgi:hypothetical protein
MSSRSLLTLSPDREPPSVRFGVPQVGDRWAAMIPAGKEPPPESRAVKGLAFLGATLRETEDAAKVYLRQPEPGNRTRDAGYSPR